MKKCGKVIVPQSENLDSQLDVLFKRGKSNGAQVEIITKKEQIEHWNAQGYDVEIGKQLSWSAGKYERSLVKNCLAVGLSDGFVEPLDGNALILSMQLLQNFLLFKGSFIVFMPTNHP